ncbi:unnamed protein product [Penicillium manginii]
MKAFKDGQGPRTHKNREIAILQRLIDKIYCPEVAKESPDKILTPKDIAEKIRAHINEHGPMRQFVARKIRVYKSIFPNNTELAQMWHFARADVLTTIDLIQIYFDRVWMILKLCYKYHLLIITSRTRTTTSLGHGIRTLADNGGVRIPWPVRPCPSLKWTP